MDDGRVAEDILIGQGAFFRPLSSKSIYAKLYLCDSTDGPRFRIEPHGDDAVVDLVMESLQGDDDLHFHGGCYFKSTQPFADDVLQNLKTRTQRRIAWLEAFTPTKAAIFAVVLISLVFGYRIALTNVVGVVAKIIPNQVEEMIGEHAYATTRRLWFEPSTLPEERQAAIRQKAARLAEAAHLDHRVDILFHSAKDIGANAFAFPGGPIVVTDDLVKLFGRDEEVLAVLAHEMAHVEERHSLQQILNVVGATALASVLFGVDDGILEELSAVVINVWGFKNSRDFEKEADLEALKFLKAAQRDPQDMLKAIEKLIAQPCKGKSGSDLQKCMTAASQGETGWAASHPGAKDRLEYLHKAIDG